MDAAKSRTLEQKNRTQTQPQTEKLPQAVQKHILDFLGSKVGEKNFNVSYKSYQAKDKIKHPTTFFGNLNILWADQLTAQIAHNLLWLIDVEETLALAQQYPKSLLTVVEIKDPYGQRVRGTPLQIVAAAGDRNPRKMKPEEKDYGLVERLRPCFQKLDDYDHQLATWLDPDSEEATKKTMAPYIQAIETLCQEIIESKEISNDTDRLFEELLDLPIAKKFRKALIPNSTHVVTAGFLFDIQIFLDFVAIFEANVSNDKIKDKARPNLGWWTLKSELFDAIVYSALQARAQRIDIGIFMSGIGNVAAGETLLRLDFSKGTPADLCGLGKSHYFDFSGNKLPLVANTDLDTPWRLAPPAGSPYSPVKIFQNLRQARTKTPALELDLTSKSTNRGGI